MPAPDRHHIFASDNAVGICPTSWEAMRQANEGSAISYGEDPWTRRACELIRELFECDCDVFFVFNGTAANGLALGALVQSYHSIICHELAHIETDECGAPEFFTAGAKLLLAGGEQGRVAPAEIERLARRRRDIHYPRPKAVSLTQATELGTVYRPDLLRELGALTNGLGLRLHVDGARFGNAVARLGCAPKELTWRAGVDVLSLGGSKNGTGLGEAVVFFDRELGAEFGYRCKQAGQLASKMRFLAAPWVGLLESGAWLANARHANAMADRLAEGLRTISGVRLLYEPQANSVFVVLPEAVKTALRGLGWVFYDFIAAGGARLVCSWATTVEDVDALLADLRQVNSVQ